MKVRWTMTEDEEVEVKKSPVDKIITYQTIVKDLASAWEFIFTKVGDMGEAPVIEVHPVMVCDIFGNHENKFRVTLTGRWEE